MSVNNQDFSSAMDEETQLVPAVYARDAEEAQRYCELLADHGIAGIVADEDFEPDDVEVHGSPALGIGMTRGVAVLVEDSRLDEAGTVIADREDAAEFQFDDEDEIEDDDDELEFAQGIDGELDDDIDSDDQDDGDDGTFLDEDGFVDDTDDGLDGEFDEF